MCQDDEHQHSNNSQMTWIKHQYPNNNNINQTSERTEITRGLSFTTQLSTLQKAQFLDMATLLGSASCKHKKKTTEKQDVQLGHMGMIPSLFKFLA